MNSKLPVKIDSISKNELFDYFKNSWELNEMLFSAINDKVHFYDQPDPLRNPLIFYYGHTAAFYINKMKLAGLINDGINEHYEIIFARGVDPDMDEEFNHIDLWPSVDEVRKYKANVFSIVSHHIKSLTEQSINENSPNWSILMAIEHDRIHFETSSVLIRQLEVEKLNRPKEWKYAPSNSNINSNQWIDFEGGQALLGRGDKTNLFAWDNEYGKKIIDVKPFSVMKNMVTNNDFLSFLNNGYINRNYWSEEGWNWKQNTQTEHPKFWKKEDGEWKYRAMFDLIKMPKDWPVEVNAFEAQAYCIWLGNGSRLMTEGEFTLASNMNHREEPLFESIGNLNLRYGSPNPVGLLEDPHSKLNDLYGNVWDWLGDEFIPLDGFKTHPLYSDFSAPYFDEDHLMMLGGSWATTGTGASKHYRLWFRKFFYQHAGFRIAKSL